MSELGDTFKAFVEAKREKRQTIEQERIYQARALLINLKWHVAYGPDDKSFTVTSPSGKRFNFWPYTGYFAEKTRGRGLRNLIKAGESK